MLNRYKRLSENEESEKKRYRQIGRDAFKHGVDRKVADDFSVHYRQYIRQGWDEEESNELPRLFCSLNIGGRESSRIRKKHGC